MEEETQKFAYSNIIGDQNELMLDKDNFSFQKYLKLCSYEVSSSIIPKIQFSDYWKNPATEQVENEAESPLINRDPVPKVKLDAEMKELIKSDIKENLKLVRDVKNQIIR